MYQLRPNQPVTLASLALFIGTIAIWAQLLANL
jgi:hypothetical protein